MNRREFLRVFGVGVAGAVCVPAVALSVKPKIVKPCRVTFGGVDLGEVEFSGIDFAAPGTESESVFSVFARSRLDIERVWVGLNRS